MIIQQQLQLLHSAQAVEALSTEKQQRQAALLPAFQQSFNKLLVLVQSISPGKITIN